MVLTILVFAVCFSSVTCLRISSSTSFDKIPNIVWVTGEWDSDSEKLSEIEENFEPTFRVQRGKEKESLDRRALQKFGKWTPLGSQIRYFSDDDMDASVRRISEMLNAKGIKDVDKAYFNLRPGAYRADLWRLMVLWAEGGVYLDANLKLVRKLEDWIDYSNDELVLVEDKGATCECHAYWNAMMAAAPRNEYLEFAIKDIVRKIDLHYYGKDPLSITGPSALGYALEKQSNFPKNVRVDLAWNVRDCVDINGTLVATKDDHLHNLDPSSHYGPLWQNRQVYCDQKGPRVDNGKCG